MASQEKGRRVYSYVRFSTPEQSLGDSERRQLTDAQSWVSVKGYKLDESHCMADRGLSGFKGHHRTRGVLGRFLGSVEAGEIPRDSILLVENIDRLSREGATDTLRGIIFKLWDFGISIATISPDQIYEPGCDNTPQFFVLLLLIQQAHEESRKKSERIRAARESARAAARDEKKLLTRLVPAWLRVTEDGRLEPIPKAVATLQMIFELKLQGIGLESIAAKLNREAPWYPPKQHEKQTSFGWRGSYIKKILGNRAVIGEYQPHHNEKGKRVPIGDPIPGYYPSVIAGDVFHAVQNRLAANKGKGGRTGAVTNLFTHLIKCAYCGGPMRLQDNGKPRGRSLVCDNAKRGVKCKCHRINYFECEKLILENCHKLRPEQVLPKPDEQAQRSLRLRQRVQGRTGELMAVEQQIGNLLDQITRTASDSMRDKYEAKMVELEQKKVEVEAQLHKDQQELQTAEASTKSFHSWKRNFDSLREVLSESNPEVRLRLQSHIRELIERIEVFPVGFKSEVGDDEDPRREFPSGETFGEHLIDVALEICPKHSGSKEFQSFLEYVLSRRMSKDGRFLRVHFKTGAIINMVPPGSIGSGMVLERGAGDRFQWKIVEPGISELETQYRASKRHKGSKDASLSA